MSRITVYLADLFYDQNAKYHAVPLNIGYIGNALKVSLGDDLDIELFKYPNELIFALRRKKPDILGLSNYAWNQFLSLKLARFAKGISNNILTVMGGPNLRSDASGMREFLSNNREIDCYIPFIGEFPFIELAKGILRTDCGTKIGEVHKALKAIDGAFLNIPEYEYRPIEPSMWKNLYKFGSPYLNKLLDKFITDVTLMPLFESNRGCPFGCTYCAFGVADYRKVYLNDMDTVIKEFQYVIDHSAGQKHWYIADANFGLFSRDVEIAKALRRIKEKYGYPIYTRGTTGKGIAYKNVIKIVDTLGDMSGPNIAVQSFDPDVLSNVHRRNLDDATIKKLVKIYADKGAETSTDIIVGLSGETFQSHISTLKKAIDMNLNFSVATLAFLPGTIMDTPEERRRYGFDVKFRIRADAYGVYDNEFIFDVEGVVCGTNTLSYDEFLDLRCIHLLAYMLWTAKIGRRLLKFGQVFCNIHPVDLMRRIQQRPSGELLTRTLKTLRKEMRAQFFESKEALMEHYRDKKRISAILKDSSIETKLFWKQFSPILAERDNTIALIDEVIAVLSSTQNADPALLDILREISIDELMIDFQGPPLLAKQKEYEISRKNYLLLQEKGLIPKAVIYNDNEMTVSYIYDKVKYKYFKDILERKSCRNNLREAINAALNLNLGANIQYNIGDS